MPDATSCNELTADEAQHAVRVLRLKPHDEIVLIDGHGSFFKAEITLAENHHCMYRITEEMPQSKLWNGHLHLAIAPTKMMDRMEWMAEKATEIGIDELSFIGCKFSERNSIKTERIGKIVVAAVKQSRKAWMPIINDMCSFRDFVATHKSDRRFIAHCYEEINRTLLFDEIKHCSPDDNITVMIGPEGDFSIDEVRMAVKEGFVSVSLGSSRLRTETAGLAAVMMMHLGKK